MRKAVDLAILGIASTSAEVLVKRERLGASRMGPDIDLRELSSFSGLSEVAEFQQAHCRSCCRGIRTREFPNSFLGTI